jgi:hypothetical protein
MRAPIAFVKQSITVESLRGMRHSIVLDPHYQRQGDVWPVDKQRLFIDSLMNGFVVPPMYWHSLDASSEYFHGANRYAVVDGRQRLETLFGFLADDLALSPDNSLLLDPSLDLSGMRLSRLREDFGWLYAEFMRSQIDVVIIETDEIDLIEEMFSRLNEGVPLKAAEKRNRGSILAPAVRAVANSHVFFTTKLPFGNKRYRHLDLVAKFMRLEDRDLATGRVPDLKKIDLDRLFNRLRELEADPVAAHAKIDDLLGRVSARLSRLAPVFVPHDPFLGSVGMVTIYYAFDKFLEERSEPPLSRAEVTKFETLRQAIKQKEESTLTDEERRVWEFAAYAQGPTSGTYLSARLRILASVLRSIDI